MKRSSTTIREQRRERSKARKKRQANKTNENMKKWRWIVCWIKQPKQSEEGEGEERIRKENGTEEEKNQQHKHKHIRIDLFMVFNSVDSNCFWVSEFLVSSRCFFFLTCNGVELLYGTTWLELGIVHTSARYVMPCRASWKRSSSSWCSCCCLPPFNSDIDDDGFTLAQLLWFSFIADTQSCLCADHFFSFCSLLFDFTPFDSRLMNEKVWRNMKKTGFRLCWSEISVLYFIFSSLHIHASNLIEYRVSPMLLCISFFFSSLQTFRHNKTVLA